MIQALATSYAGHTFRSRLEARWAFYLSALGVAWEYEREAFDLDGLTYFPDFWLPSHRVWLETKGEIISDQIGLATLEKCKRLAALSSHPVILAFNDPLDQRCAVFGVRGGFYNESHFTVCLVCGELGVNVRTPDGTRFLCPGGKAHAPISTQAIQLAQRRSFNAATAARQQRFGFSRKVR